MEQKKILWIIVSAALFLTVVFTAGLLWFYPSKGVQTAADGKNGAGKANIDFDPVEWVRNSNNYPGLDTSKTDKEKKNDEFTIVYGEDDSNAAPSVITEGEKVTTAVEAPAAVPVKEEKKEAPSSSVSKAAPAKAVSQPVKPAAHYVTEYWIQAGSFKSMSGAQSAKETLSSEGVASRITIKTVDGVDYYRVRIGPYSNKKEAEKFLAWVKKIEVFGSSYISSVTVKR